MIVGTALGISVGRFSRWYVLILTRKKDEHGNTVYVLVAQRDDGYRFLTLRVKDRLDVRDVIEMLDTVVEMIRKKDRSTLFQLIGRTGLLDLVYEKRSVWL
jgi:hypothetical protein